MDGVQWVHVLALMGDASDNVPGVPGVGAKGALSLIQQYGSVESVLENADKVTLSLPQFQVAEHEAGAGCTACPLLPLGCQPDLRLGWHPAEEAADNL